MLANSDNNFWSSFDSLHTCGIIVDKDKLQHFDACCFIAMYLYPV